MKTLLTSALSALLLLLPLGSVADYTFDDGSPNMGDPDAKDIVITFSQDLGQLRWNGRLKRVNRKSVEQACLALTLAQFLRSDPEGKVNVTLFVRNNGVKLADRGLVSAISVWQVRTGRECQMPNPDPYEPPMFFRLDNHLENFLADNPNNLVNCPLCWCKYHPDDCPDYGDYDGYGVLDPSAIPLLFWGADNTIDF